MFYYVCALVYAWVYVKLNNPLMGAETKWFMCISIAWVYNIVKLNNPLMGAETRK